MRAPESSAADTKWTQLRPCLQVRLCTLLAQPCLQKVVMSINQQPGFLQWHNVKEAAAELVGTRAELEEARSRLRFCFVEAFDYDEDRRRQYEHKEEIAEYSREEELARARMGPMTDHDALMLCLLSGSRSLIVWFEGESVGPLLDVNFLSCGDGEGYAVLEDIVRNPDSVEDDPPISIDSSTFNSLEGFSRVMSHLTRFDSLAASMLGPRIGWRTLRAGRLGGLSQEVCDSLQRGPHSPLALAVRTARCEAAAAGCIRSASGGTS